MSQPIEMQLEQRVMLLKKKITDCKTLADFMKLFDAPLDKDKVPTGNAPIYDFPEEI